MRPLTHDQESPTQGHTGANACDGNISSFLFQNTNITASSHVTRQVYDPVGQPLSTWYGRCDCIGCCRFLGLQHRHRRGTLVGTWGWANGIIALL